MDIERYWRCHSPGIYVKQSSKQRLKSVEEIQAVYCSQQQSGKFKEPPKPFDMRYTAIDLEFTLLSFCFILLQYFIPFVMVKYILRHCMMEIFNLGFVFFFRVYN